MQLENSKKTEHFPSSIELNGKKILYDKAYQEGYDVILGLNDVTDFIKDIPKESVMFVVTSPPYNIGKPYEERLEFKEYLKWQKEIIEECIRILNPQGSICWQVGNYIEDKEVFPLDLYFYRILKDLKLKLRNRIIWRVGHGLHARTKFSGRYETVLWFTKGEDYIFNLDDIRVPQKYPGKRAYRGPNNGKPSSNPLGKNPSNFWEFIIRDWDMQVWNIPNVKASHSEKTIHPCQFPIELVERLVLALTNESDVVFDPFSGVGSAIIAAILHNRKGIGVEKEQKYTDVSYQRILSAINGTLKKRELGKPVYQPKGEKVARFPQEWIKKT